MLSLTRKSYCCIFFFWILKALLFPGFRILVVGCCGSTSLYFPKRLSEVRLLLVQVKLCAAITFSFKEKLYLELSFKYIPFHPGNCAVIILQNCRYEV